ncbi:Translation initiation factor IF2/IF5 [Haladaptatus paucihalophilus DX253]|uniref:Translation initiation factor 2 subunit 2 n=1 Tax=Haladaptatus paucihalophilus DX253 TaxID=797209 RepID=E7QTW5_HALPU|nr:MULTISPECIES: translation initiation factor IF-2 subunit beta [Haladaptatus]EFW92044.1 Translation initiation factor IF2/IF5 [Haladaptatus paucihalophilus DX253]ODR82449.1 translation initiation factor IF-2 subunit beta [Haladaptatus sp. W1]GKZ14199.1 translation initiation factor IF-2 subunit beta [Haladaptatus sp. T7]SHK86690.1 translation initiation factor 2 subunit 2 [Haladaptatus paucihalophilus DX253]
MDYNSALDRGMDAVPDLETSDERFSYPDPAVQKDGSFTRLTNLDDIADALSRDGEHVHSALQRELGTSGKYEEGQARYSGSFTESDFNTALDEYVEEFVICSECGLPDTRLVRENRNLMLRCDACGAFRPVTKRSTTSRTQQRDAVEEGRTYEVKITGTGRKGDGVAERGKYTIFVPGAQKGDEVQVYIESVRGNLAFARLA